jgi:hypothetical protein
MVAGTPKNGNVESDSPSGAMGVSRWQMARSAAEIRGAMSSNIGEKPSSLRCARATSGLWGSMSPTNAMVIAVSSGTVVLDSLTVFEVQAVKTGRHAMSAARFTLSI